MNPDTAAALLGQFKAFHADLTAYLRTLAGSGQAPELVRARIGELIGAAPVPGSGGQGADLAQELHYLMAAFADEMLLARAWEHQQVWIDYLLEAWLFGTRNAGDKVFSRIRELERDPGRHALAQAYLYALALGFHGRFGASEAHQRELAGMRTGLFALARGRAPDPLFAGQDDDLEHHAAQRHMGRPYQHTVAHGTPVLLPNPYRWRAFFFLAFGALMLVALSIWIGRTRELRQHFEQTARSPAQASGPTRPGAAPATAHALRRAGSLQ